MNHLIQPQLVDAADLLVGLLVSVLFSSSQTARAWINFILLDNVVFLAH